jgi:hypothetical protein
MRTGPMPVHVGIILDGNRRFGRRHGLTDLHANGSVYFDPCRGISPVRFNLEPPIIDHLPVLHYGCLARDRLIPLVAVRKFLLHVEPGSAFRKVRPTDGLIIMRDPNKRSLTWHIIESPQKFSVHTKNSGKRVVLAAHI